MQQLTTDLVPKSSKFFNCIFCNYITCRKSQLSRHELTDKHKNNVFATNNNKKVPKVPNCICENCGKIYKERTALWRHRKKCIDISITNNNSLELDKITVLEIIKQNQDFKELIIDQQNKILELSQKPNTVINNTNHQFNLNVFLNEKCKDAINIMDFVNSLQLQINDLEETGRLGFTEGITRIFINGLKELDIYKRPLHCSDIKREVLYVKDANIWVKENEDKQRIKHAIKVVANKNIHQIVKWQAENPEYKNPESKKSDKYMKLICESMCGSTNQETEDNYNKIIKNIAKKTTIEK